MRSFDRPAPAALPLFSAVPGERSPEEDGGALARAEIHHSPAGHDSVVGAALWRAGPGWRMAGSSVLGGGIGPRSFVLNAQVGHGYRRMDPENHLRDIAAWVGAHGEGMGLLTAADVSAARLATDGGVEALATVGLGRPIWAAAPERPPFPSPDGDFPGYRPGTINIVVAVPAALSDAALLNTLMTTTEAKAQALWRAGLACTGTASDAVCVASRVDARAGRDEFGGPRSYWGARVARAVFTAVHSGAVAEPAAPVAGDG